MQGIPVLEDFVHRISESFDVTVFSMIKTDKAYQSQGFTLLHTSASHSHYTFWKMALLAILFIKSHSKNRYQLIHGIWGFPSGFMAVVFSKIFRIPSIVSLQGAEAANVPEINYGHMRSFIKRKTIRWACKQISALTVLTHFQINELSKYGFQRKDVHVIPYGADETLFTPMEKTPTPPFRFIHVANLTRVKDQTTLLKAFKLISEKTDASLRIVGDGEDANLLKTLAKSLDIEQKIEFTGAIPHKSLPEHLQWAHVMLHTSLYEGQAVVIAEAAACGTVVCGTKIGLMADWGNEKCVAVDCGDFKMLANSVLELLGNYEKYTALQTNAKEWARNHTPSVTAGCFKKLYVQLVP